MAELVQGQSAPVGMKAEGFVDALHRVRQIAAKIDSIPHLNNSTPLVDPSVYGYGVQKRPLDDGVGNQLGALVHQRAVITEEFKVPDKMVGFIIGRGGEQISRIQAESGCKIQIASESSGIPERPCVLTGTPESIEQAKRLLGQIVDRCRNGPGFHDGADSSSAVQELLIPASKVGLVIGKGGETIKQLQERTGVKMVMIQDGPMPTGADKPLRISGDPFKVQQAREMVLEIIREKDQADFRGVRGDFSSRMGGGSMEVSVPRFAVGIVIGRNGEMIKKIQNDAGVRIQFKPGGTWRRLNDGVSPERAAQVTGPPDRCQHAAHIIGELVLTAQERDGFGGLAVARGRGRGRGDWSMGAPGAVQEITYSVPADKCGLVIGKGGENIKSINQQSGAHVELQRSPPPNTDPSLRIFTIRGTPQQIEVARHLIDEKVGVRTGLAPPRPEGWAFCWMFEGAGLGAPGAFGQSPFGQPPAAPHQNAFPPRSSGCFPNIAAKVNGNPHSTPVSGPPAFLTQGWGSTYQAWQQPTQQVPSQQSQPPSSQPDYSKAWEDYYKKQSHAAPAAPQASSPPDYTMAWAEYYRQQVAFYGQTLGQAQTHSQVRGHCPGGAARPSWPPLHPERGGAGASGGGIDEDAGLSDAGPLWRDWACPQLFSEGVGRWSWPLALAPAGRKRASRRLGQQGRGRSAVLHRSRRAMSSRRPRKDFSLT
ncbi:Far upstream element-binding protein 3 [Galemys pyrenaicus]|uniref:Far upstream element-binding protein 3 n=1 Tax=Galemys pyrenaicus TaxID=202257 RepID=A0A8J5ZYH5_GALPY|nr:Far upstream element-binding protein 3 [Galemys pyrenaicus]